MNASDSKRNNADILRIEKRVEAGTPDAQSIVGCSETKLAHFTFTTNEDLNNLGRNIIDDVACPAGFGKLLESIRVVDLWLRLDFDFFLRCLGFWLNRLRR